MLLDDVVKFMGTLVQLGVSPPVQSALTSFFARHLGIPQSELEAAIQAGIDAPDPKV